jgi:hypothetical protein
MTRGDLPFWYGLFIEKEVGTVYLCQGYTEREARRSMSILCPERVLVRLTVKDMYELIGAVAPAKTKPDDYAQGPLTILHHDRVVCIWGEGWRDNKTGQDKNNVKPDNVEPDKPQ